MRQNVQITYFQEETNFFSPLCHWATFKILLSSFPSGKKTTLWRIQFEVGLHNIINVL